MKSSLERRIPVGGICLILFLQSVAASASQPSVRKPVVAVLKLDATAGVPSDVAVALDGVLSSELFKTGRYELVSRDRIDEVIKEFKIQTSGMCDTTKCFAALGGAMGADKLVAGSVSKLGRTYLLSLKLIDITLIKEEYVDTVDCACEVDGLLGKMRELVQRMAAEITGPAGDAAAGSSSLRVPPAKPTDSLPGRPDAPSGVHASVSRSALEHRDGKTIRTADAMEMVLIEAGAFVMGSEDNDADERPAHRVRLSRAFMLDRHEVTNEQYVTFLNAQRPGDSARKRWVSIAGEEECSEDDDELCPGITLEGGRFLAISGRGNHPVVWISWDGAEAYCRSLGARLPSEAEWEYVAHAGARSRYTWGDSNLPPPGAGNFGDDSNSRRLGLTQDLGYDDGFPFTSPVCQFKRNPFGLCDISGNAWEWVSDWYDGTYYQRSPEVDPRGPDSGEYHALRGGSWGEDPDHSMVTNRFRGLGGGTPERGDRIGLRCAWDL